MQSSSRRFLLRERTTRSHDRVDAAIGNFDTLGDYTAYLAAMHAFRLSVENVLADFPWPAAVGAWRPTLIARLVEHDMVDLRVDMQKLPQHAVRIDDLSQLCGLLYVLEGSALGARVLYRRAQALGLTEEFGARHLARQAESVDSWRGYLDILDRAAPFDLDAAAEASIGVFRIAENAFAGMRQHAG